MKKIRLFFICTVALIAFSNVIAQRIYFNYAVFTQGVESFSWEAGEQIATAASYDELNRELFNRKLSTNSFGAFLDSVGFFGWELVNFIQQGDKTVYIFIAVN